jgi:uncharacterized membrane protein
MTWLRRRLITGFFVTVPLVASVVALVWVVRIIDGLTSGVPERLILQRVPGLQGIEHIPGLGIVLTALFVLLVGILATNVFGRRLLQQAEAVLMHVPVFRTIYGPLKQLTEAFSPDNESGFKRVVLVERGPREWTLGFLTKEFVADRGNGPETRLAVYVPTNHLYLGNVVVCSRDRVSFPDLTVEQGIRIFLTGGMALPSEITARPEGLGTDRADAGGES